MTKRHLGQATACIAAVCALTNTARAGTGEYALTDSSGLEYSINDDITFSTTSSASGALSEASYNTSIAATTEDGSTELAQLSDMFDGARALWVSLDGVTTEPQTGQADMTVYSGNGPASLACDDREVVFPVQTIGDLAVSRRVYVPATDTFARHLDIITNTGSSPLTFTVGSFNNLGSDSDTQIDSTSDGDTDIELSDNWISSFEAYSSKSSADVRIGHVLKAEGKLGASFDELVFVDGDDNPYWWWTLTLNPGETQILAGFVTGQPSRAAARDKAAELVAMTNAHMFDCVSAEERTQIVNFPVACAGAGAAGTICNDFDRCTLDDVCVDGACVGTDKECRSDAADCTGVCEASTGECVENDVPDDTACADANLCNGGETCQTGTCTSLGVSLECDDSSACTADSCDAVSGCGHTAISCDDSSACTADSCDAVSGCAHTAVSCDDSSACTADSCDTASGCAHTAVSCDDSNACTADSCDTASGCAHAAISGCQVCVEDADCDDSDPCTGTETCGGAGTCQAGTAIDCSDAGTVGGGTTGDASDAGTGGEQGSTTGDAADAGAGSTNGGVNGSTNAGANGDTVDDSTTGGTSPSTTGAADDGSNQVDDGNDTSDTRGGNADGDASDSNSSSSGCSTTQGSRTGGSSSLAWLALGAFGLVRRRRSR